MHNKHILLCYVMVLFMHELLSIQSLLTFYIILHMTQSSSIFRLKITLNLIVSRKIFYIIRNNYWYKKRCYKKNKNDHNQ
ncbi:hypothetical protein D6C61_24635 [Escherichia coli]|nr:hypothetical protein D6C61_24635 [Escherichia coli]